MHHVSRFPPRPSDRQPIRLFSSVSYRTVLNVRLITPSVALQEYFTTGTSFASLATLTTPNLFP